MIAVIRQLGGVEPRECTLCGYQGLFRALDHPPRYDAQCPGCDSRERHRLFALLLRAQPGLGRDGRIVHFAPERGLVGLLRERAAQYRTADLFADGCDLRLDIERLELPGGSVDLFVLNHVLEHVDDRKALSELYRCLAPGGVAAISTPVVEGWSTTYENEEVARGDSDSERMRHFGWPDHLRYYGADLRDRIREAGFVLEEFVADGAEALRYGLLRGEIIFLAHKPLPKR